MATGETTKYVRFSVTRAEQHQLRLAAANQNLDMATFAKRTALRVAAEEVEQLTSTMKGGAQKHGRRGPAKRTVPTN
jgi:hypothetical protein